MVRTHHEGRPAVSISHDHEFRHQFDANPREDPDVEAALSGQEPARSAQAERQAPRMETPAPQFTWLKPLR